MKYMFASDVHGSAYYCRKMLNAYKEETGKDVQVLLLQNHGIFVAADTVEEIGVYLIVLLKSWKNR